MRHTKHEPSVLGRMLAAALALGLAAAACGGDDATAGPNPLAASQWEATSVYDGAVMQGTHPTTIVTIVFGVDDAEGFDGCNRYGVPYRVDGDRIAFGDITSTGSACASGEHAPQATAFLDALSAVTGFDLSGDELEMSNDTGTLLRLRRAMPLPLLGISWWMTGYRAPGGGLTSPLDGAPVHLWFGRDESIVGSTGCNSYSAAFDASDTQLSIEGLSFTEMACSEPAGVMVQEADYLALLPTTESFRTGLTTLELLDGDDQVVATFTFGGRTR